MNMQRMNAVTWLALVVGLTAVLAGASERARAHETDQFDVPVGRTMADVGPEINALFVERLEQAVDRVNAQIRKAVEQPESLRTRPRGHGPNRRSRPSRQIDAQAVLDVCQSPDGIAEATWRSFGSAVDLIEHLNTFLHSKKMIAKYAPELPAYKATDHGTSVYNGLYFVADPRTGFRTFHATSFNAFGTYMGADKVGHFTDMGYLYFKEYRKRLAAGKSPEEAMAAATKWGTSGTFSEAGLLGFVTAGAYSHADLASNYVGMLFYRNLTEPVMLKGKLYPPMLERDGEYWKLADFVKGDPRFVARFISDHYDEALNPSLFEPLVRPTLRKKVAEKMPALMVWYADRYGDEDPQTYFRDLVIRLSTYYGAEYGHSGKFDDLVGLWNTPYDKDALAPASERQTAPATAARE